MSKFINIQVLTKQYGNLDTYVMYEGKQIVIASIMFNEELTNQTEVMQQIQCKLNELTFKLSNNDNIWFHKYF